MKLNPDCIRDILFTIEEQSDFCTSMLYSPSNNHEKFLNLKKYTSNEVLYHMKQCEYSGLIIVSNWLLDPGVVIDDLTPKGHEFLANIRTDTNWNKTKEVAQKVGSDSLNILTQIAAKVISNLITNV
jgi:hypothetical protein